MNTHTDRCSSRPLSTLWNATCATLLGAAAQARPSLPAPQQPAFDLAAITAEPLDSLMFDDSVAGRVWARSESYKARFDASGATIIPFFGSEAPSSFPIGLRVRGASIGAAPLAMAPASGATRAGNVVRIDHGSFSEVYELAADRLEQRFVFDSLPRQGDIVLRLGLESDLSRSERGGSLRLENELGYVEYGQAFGVDAVGRSIPLERSMEDGEIVLRVPADFAATAQMPLVVDPFVTFFTVSGGPHHELMPDISYDVSTGLWCVTWVDVFSASDHDVYVRFVSGAGQLLDTLTIDFTGDSWTLPGIANCNSGDDFLVCASVVPVSGISDVRGKLVFPISRTVGPEIQISPLGAGYSNWADVGGDLSPTNGAFCVVWQRWVSNTNVDIDYVLLNPDGSFRQSVAALEGSPSWFDQPRISNSAGREVGDGQACWTITAQRQFSSSDRDVYAAQVRRNGTISQPMFGVETSFFDETRPKVATLLDPAFPGAPRATMIVYETNVGPDYDVMAAIIQNGQVLLKTNLVGDFPPQYWYLNQWAPAVDSDGNRFVIAFEEYATQTVQDIWVSSYFWVNGILAPCEVHRPFAGSPAPEVQPAVCSMYASGGPAGPYFGAWTFGSASNGFDLQGGLWNGATGGLVTSFCSGDASSLPCPCGGEETSAGRGCGNSVNPAGALLDHSGDASLGADSLQLEASGMPPSASCLFFQGGLEAGLPFGDGLLCAGGPTVRLGLLHATVGGVASFPQAGGPSIHVKGQVPAAGLTRYYQVWYRDSGAHCTSAPYNLTNALRVVWAP